MAATATSGTRFHDLVLRICTAWAVLGGFVLLGVIIINVIPIVIDILAPGLCTRRADASETMQFTFEILCRGDFELTEIGVAIAVFAFLPYCQIAGLNVTADIFTSGANRFWLSVFSLLGSTVALIFGVVLLWRMYAGMLDHRTYDSTTALLQIPLWWGYAPCLISLALLALASFASVTDALSDMFGRR
ncbi:TRAP transporter small permease [Anianabacter salinae]|uniref:TRAP transporter small permease n=1 Tax=Anianabacter salinae TaxID=2851023 RepID=UPI00225E30AF|nr:TRAP transporter small permease subunit [Anianabacter salinae]MBV0912158.1 TRAP transporter small permease [Anianabacter salinae]